MKLSKMELKKILGGGREDFRGENIYSKCPKCGFQEFGISTKEGHKFGCFRKSKCGWTGNIWTLLIELGILGDYLREKQISEGNKILDRINLEEIEEEEKEDILFEEIPLPFKYARLTGEELNNPVTKYLKGRGWDFENEVGYSSIDKEVGWGRYAIFPVRMNQNSLNGWVARSIKSKREIETHNLSKPFDKILRYKNSVTDFGKLFYGWEEEKILEIETVILVEGIFDKVNIDKLFNLSKNKKIICYATFKCGVSEEQLILLKKLKKMQKLIIFYDNDVVEKIKRVCIFLEKLKVDLFVAFNDEDSRDAGDADEELIENIFNNLKKPYDFFMNKVQKKLLNE
jgi:hypothetical protein